MLMCAPSCHTEHHSHEKGGRFLCTTPLRKDLEIIREYVAQIRAIQHIEVRALERGYLQEIFVDEGQLVSEETKMFQIMPIVYQAELHRAQAEAKFARIEFDNTKILAESKVVSPNELALARARLEKARAERELAAVHRQLTEIRAPFDGIVGRFRVRLGSLVEEGELLTTLSDNRRIWVYFNVAEAEYLDYQLRRKGEEQRSVRLIMANNMAFPHPGKIDTIEADFNNETGNIAFRASFPNPDRLLRHGETGKIQLMVPLENALVIPQKATFEVLDRKHVFVVDGEQRVRSREISIVEELPHVYAVGSGLSEEDIILVDGLRRVEEGHRIQTSVQSPAKVMEHLSLPAE